MFHRLMKIHKLGTSKKFFRQIEKKFKLYQEVAKPEVIKKKDNHSKNSGDYATVYYQTLEEVPGTLVLEFFLKFQKDSRKLK